MSNYKPRPDADSPPAEAPVRITIVSSVQTTQTLPTLEMRDRIYNELEEFDRDTVSAITGEIAVKGEIIPIRFDFNTTAKTVEWEFSEGAGNDFCDRVRIKSSKEIAFAEVGEYIPQIVTSISEYVDDLDILSAGNTFSLTVEFLNKDPDAVSFGKGSLTDRRTLDSGQRAELFQNRMRIKGAKRGEISNAIEDLLSLAKSEYIN